MEVTNRFKGLDLIDRVPDELWMEVPDIVQEAVIKAIPKKNKCQKANGCLRMPYKYLRKKIETKGKGEKERYTDLTAEFQRIARRDKKAFLSDQFKNNRGKQEWERLDSTSRKLEISRENFMQRWAQ